MIQAVTAASTFSVGAKKLIIGTLEIFTWEWLFFFRLVLLQSSQTIIGVN